MFGWRKKVPEGPAPPVDGNVHSFVADNRAGDETPAPYIPVGGGGYDGWSPHIPLTGPQPSNPYVFYPQPPPGDPADYYKRRNSWKITDYSHTVGLPTPQIAEVPFENAIVSIDPERVRPRPSRMTNFLSPATGPRDVVDRPLGQKTPWNLNGSHFSMASNRRTYPIGGMAPARRFRNTFRLSPPPQDAGNVDMPPPEDMPMAGVQVSPAGAVRSATFRLS